MYVIYVGDKSLVSSIPIFHCPPSLPAARDASSSKGVSSRYPTSLTSSLNARHWLTETPWRRHAPAASSRTRATADISALSAPVDDPEAILRQSRRALRSANATRRAAVVPAEPVQDSADQQLDKTDISAGPEAPSSHPDSDPWGVREDILSRSRHLSSSLGPASESLSLPDEEDPWAALYRRIGYLPPLDEATLELLRQVVTDPSMGSTAKRINPSALDQFRDGLKDRNAALEPCHDSFLDHIRSLSTTSSDETPAEKMRKSVAWDLDLKKTINDPQEPVFQRTVLMSMIDRHRFIYNQGDNKEPVLDFSVERLWNCRPMPSLVFQNPEPMCLSMPKADLAVAFRQSAIFQNKYWQILPKELRETVCYEGQAAGRVVRVFHFLTIETKNGSKDSDDEVGLCQSLNNATQSLHNMYEFFREAGEEHVQTFFAKVRVFSAVSTSKGIKIRAHRACLTEEVRPESADDADLDGVPPMCSILQDYLLQFIYDEFFEASSSDFTRENVVSILEKIMVGYGIKELWGHLRKAAGAIETKCIDYRDKNKDAKRLWREEGYYTHGLVLPKRGSPSHVSRSTRATNSTVKPVGRELRSLSLERSQHLASQARVSNKRPRLS